MQIHLIVFFTCSNWSRICGFACVLVSHATYWSKFTEFWDGISHDVDAMILLVLTFILYMLNNRNSSPIIPRQYNHQLYYFISQKKLCFTPALLFPPLLNLQLFVVNLAFRRFKWQEPLCMNFPYYGTQAVTLKPLSSTELPCQVTLSCN